jgi:hypothetical protein
MLSRLFEEIKQILALRRDVDAMRAEMKVIRDEWDDWFDRFRRLHARIARRQARDEQSPEEGSTQPSGESSGSPMTPTLLSPKAQLIAKQIADHRRANGGR